jgi:3-isopropylmalate dehydrogenase
VGTGRANPLAAIRSAALMLDHLGEPDAAARITKAVLECARSAPAAASTTEIGDLVAERV